MWSLIDLTCNDDSIIFKNIYSRNLLNTLFNYLNNTDDSLVSQVITCIGNIIIEDIEFRDQAIEIGILEKVIELSKDLNKTTKFINNCLFLISNIYRHKPIIKNSKVKFF